jgi:Protein of unknown function (DUF2800)
VEALRPVRAPIHLRDDASDVWDLRQGVRLKEPEVIVIPEGEHSSFGPSSSERWMNCPGSKGGEQSKYAAEGTAAHSLSEWVRMERKPASHWKGKILRVGEYDFKVGKSMIDSVMTFVDDVEKIPGAPVIEGRVGYEELVPGAFGTLDDGRLRDDLCVITDLKHGKGVVVGAEDNSQLKLYALGLYFSFKWVFSFDRFVLRISQPRRKHFVEWETSLGSLLQWGFDQVRPAYKRALVSDERHAGPWCKFCGFKNECSERARYKMEHDSGTFVRDADEELETLDEE